MLTNLKFWNAKKKGKGGKREKKKKKGKENLLDETETIEFAVAPLIPFTKKKKSKR